MQKILFVKIKNILAGYFWFILKRTYGKQCKLIIEYRRQVLLNVEQRVFEIVQARIFTTELAWHRSEFFYQNLQRCYAKNKRAGITHDDWYLMMLDDTWWCLIDIYGTCIMMLDRQTFVILESLSWQKEILYTVISFQRLPLTNQCSFGLI